MTGARPGALPYPTRAFRTDRNLYILNFEHDRWPMGDPGPITDDFAPSAEELTEDTMVAFKDLDASPTKAWLVEHRNEPEWQAYYNYCFAKRPEEELYDLATDPDQTVNIAAKSPATTMQFAELLLGALQVIGDPRLENVFDHPPYVEEDA